MEGADGGSGRVRLVGEELGVGGGDGDSGRVGGWMGWDFLGVALHSLC